MNIAAIVMLVIGTVLSIIYILCLLSSSKKYTYMIEGLELKKHFFKAVYPVGFLVLDIINYKFNSKLDKQRLKECSVIYGVKYSEYFFRLNYASKMAVALLVLPFIFLFYAIINNSLAFIIGLVVMFCAYWNYDMKITDIMKVRNEDIERDLPNILSKLTLLVNAGMILSEAWVKVSATGKSTIYNEMDNAIMEIQNGTSETEAYLNFADRCMNIEVKKFISTLVQNITKGNKELVEYLKKQTELSWEEKKHNVRRQGEKASSKLLIPIGIMFIGIIVLVVVPIFANFSF